MKGLEQALQEAGHSVVTTAIPHSEAIDQISNSMLACRLLNAPDSGAEPFDFVIGLHFPAYLIKHPNKVLWISSIYQDAYSPWEQGNKLKRNPEGRGIRAAVRRADRTACAEAARVYTASTSIATSLEGAGWSHSTLLLHPPAASEEFHCDSAQDFFFVPTVGNLDQELDLLLDAFKLTKTDTKLIFSDPCQSGKRERIESTSEKLGIADRIGWMDGGDRKAVIEHYARSLAVLCPTSPNDDYCYSSLEAMLSAKPVVTFEDSRATLEFVVEQETGYVTERTAESLAEAMISLSEDRSRARQLGLEGLRRYQALGISWQKVVGELTA